MSRIGLLPIDIPAGVTVSMDGPEVTISSAKGELKVKILDQMEVKNENNQLVVTRMSDSKEALRQHGLMRTLLYNAIHGVATGFTKTLEINGVGFKVQVSGNSVVLNLGYSHPQQVDLPDGITAAVDGNRLSISGIDKQLVGQVAANIRGLRPPEPYKGKGIKYEDERIVRKAGKTAGAGK